MSESAYDANDPVAERNARRDAGRRRRNNRDVIATVLASKAGRDWFYDVLAACHIYSTPFEPGAPDVTAFRLGEENVGKQLMLEAIGASPENYLMMVKEAKAEEERLEDVRRKEETARNTDQVIELTGEGRDPNDLPPPKGWPGHYEPKPL